MAPKAQTGITATISLLSAATWAGSSIQVAGSTSTNQGLSPAWITAWAVATKVQAGNTTSDAINNFLSTLSFQGVAKPVKFQPDGDVVSTDIFVYQVKNGQLSLLGNTKDAKLG